MSAWVVLIIVIFERGLEVQDDDDVDYFIIYSQISCYSRKGILFLGSKIWFNVLSLPFFHLIPKRGYTPVLSLKYAYVLWGNICKVLTVRSKLSFVAIHWLDYAQASPPTPLQFRPFLSWNMFKPQWPFLGMPIFKIYSIQYPFH